MLVIWVWERTKRSTHLKFPGYPADQRTLTLFKPALKGLPLDFAIGQYPELKDINHLC